MPGEFPEYPEQRPDNLGYQTSEGVSQESSQSGIDPNSLTPNEFFPQPTTPEAQSPNLVSDEPAPAPDLPEMTYQERIEEGEALSKYQEALTTPENVKFSPEQEKNNEVMEGLLKKYPNAFIERSTDDGKKYLLLKVCEKTSEDNILKNMNYVINDQDNSDNRYDDGNLRRFFGGIYTAMLSYRGLTRIPAIIDDYKGVDLTPVLDADIVNKGVMTGKKNTDGSDEILFGSDSYIKHVSMGKDISFTYLKKILVYTEDYHKKIADEAEEDKTTYNVERMLDSL